MKRCKRGEWGYIQYKKKKAWTMILIILAIAVGIFLTGLFLNDMSKSNIFTVFAVLCVLPWAKQVVALVVVFPYHSVSRERYTKVKSLIQDPVQLYTDMVITSPEKIMNLDFAIVGYGQVFVLVGKQGQDVEYIREYLSEGVTNWGDFNVKVMDNEIIFLKEIENIAIKESDEEETERVNSYLLSLIV